MPLEIQTLNEDEREKQKQLFLGNLDYIQEIINSLDDLETGSETRQKISTLSASKKSRLEAFSQEFDTPERKAIVIPSSMARKEVKAIRMALTTIRRMAASKEVPPLIDDMIGAVSGWLDSESNKDPKTVYVSFLNSESSSATDLQKQINEFSQLYLSLDDNESKVITDIQSRFIFNQSEIIQFPESEMRWMNKLQNTVIDSIHRYAQSPKPRDFEHFKTELAKDVKSIVQLIDKSSSMSFIFKIFINSLYTTLKLQPPFRAAEEIAKVRADMKTQLSMQKEILEKPIEETPSPMHNDEPHLK